MKFVLVTAAALGFSISVAAADCAGHAKMTTTSVDTETKVASVLKQKMPGTKIVVAEPETAPMLTAHADQPRNADGSPSARNAAWKPHPFQGWSPDVVPKIMGDAVAAKLVDEILTVAGPDALKMSQQLAQKEGIFVGITAGGTFAATLKVAEKAPPGSTILAMLPDTGERYLSTPLFADVPADMTEEELQISVSTPGQQLPPKPAASLAQLPKPSRPKPVSALCNELWLVRSAVPSTWKRSLRLLNKALLRSSSRSAASALACWLVLLPRC